MCDSRCSLLMHWGSQIVIVGDAKKSLDRTEHFSARGFWKYSENPNDVNARRRSCFSRASEE